MVQQFLTVLKSGKQPRSCTCGGVGIVGKVVQYFPAIGQPGHAIPLLAKNTNISQSRGFFFASSIFSISQRCLPIPGDLGTLTNFSQPPSRYFYINKMYPPMVQN